MADEPKTTDILHESSCIKYPHPHIGISIKHVISLYNDSDMVHSEEFRFINKIIYHEHEELHDNEATILFIEFMKKLYDLPGGKELFEVYDASIIKK